jgi:hypothetical protein
MQNRKELRQKGTIGVKNDVSQEGEKTSFPEKGGGINIVLFSDQNIHPHHVTPSIVGYDIIVTFTRFSVAEPESFG